MSQNLSTETLQRENAQLKSDIKELEQFVHTVSHDLKAPLHSMMGLIGLANHPGTPPETVKEYLFHINKSVVQLNTFVQDLINYTRNISMDISGEKIQMTQFVNDIFQNLGYLVEAENLRLEVESPNLDVMGDYVRLKMILNNLISNAIFYSSGAKDAFVKVSFENTAEGLKVKVADNGIGIDEQYHHQIFKMFYRISSDGTGSGLGLYIVKEAVDKLKGKISVESSPGKGAAFTVILPFFPPQ